MEYCICGHVTYEHRDKLFPELISKGKLPSGSSCLFVITPGSASRFNSICPCLKFKLDNLKLIEDLAKERNLL